METAVSDEIETRLGAIEESLSWIKKCLEEGHVTHSKIRGVLDGNGKLGLVAKVGILWYGHAAVVGIAASAVGSVVTMIAMKLLKV